MKERQKTVTCYACGNALLDLVGENCDFPGCNIYKCSKCSFIFTWPVPSKTDLSDIYKVCYRKVRNESLTCDYLKMAKARAVSQKRTIEESGIVLRGAKILDIGCASGTFLRELLSEGAAVYGFEPDVEMYDYANDTLGPEAKIWNSVFDAEVLGGQRFDLILGSHVLEHVFCPKSFLSDLFSLLSDTGCIFLEVPHETKRMIIEKIEHNISGHMHLWYFSRNTLERMIVESGGEILSLTNYGPSINHFSHLPIWKRSLLRKKLWKYNQKIKKYSRDIIDFDSVLDPRRHVVGLFDRKRLINGIYLRAVFRHRVG